MLPLLIAVGTIIHLLAAPEDPTSCAGQIEGWTGNRHRKLWKSTCTRAALNV